MPRSTGTSFAAPISALALTWCDTKLAVLLFPNITRNFSESYQARFREYPLGAPGG